MNRARLALIVLGGCLVWALFHLASSPAAQSTVEASAGGRRDSGLASAAGGTTGPVFPGAHWHKAAEVGKFGLSSAGLKALTPFLESLDTAAMEVVVDGEVVYEYGDVSKVSYLASCRKGILGMLYGNYVASGQIRLDETLREMKLDDVGGLLPEELNATIDDLLTARSAIFHPAASSGDAIASAPPRGSQKPGRYFLYNNWDFNAAGGIFERLTGQDIYQALNHDLAIPLGMEDFDLSQQKKAGDRTRSIYLGYPIYLSTRDMARLGYLMLCRGNWNGRQLEPRDWLAKITTMVTPVEGINPPTWRAYAEGGLWGYGRLWWVWDDHNNEGPFAGAYTGWGVYGQFITVLPALKMVICHKTIRGKAPDGHDRNVSVMQYQAILMHLVAAHAIGAIETRK